MQTKMNGRKRNGPAGVGTTAQALRKSFKSILRRKFGKVNGKIRYCSCGTPYKPNWDRPYCCRECESEASLWMLDTLERMNPSQIQQMNYEWSGMGLARLKELWQGVPVWKENSK